MNIPTPETNSTAAEIARDLRKENDYPNDSKAYIRILQKCRKIERQREIYKQTLDKILVTNNEEFFSKKVALAALKKGKELDS